ncbi:glycosyl hydrolase family 18 protein [Hoeflea poritis]|uniref:chitinase n=1 Tax=Hoeflea poritis TaxID=2993659 RepID=A0ABT4VK91_9HYPH|nr:glycosyl hydrolase family 18 protein [Hoeflea poritis]MDA4845134.1 glycosyl hydrolase family 18 protein [Hoeflea poritis]
MEGTFEDFLAALLAFESGWDRERYNAGIIQDWQLDQWAGGTVSSFYPNRSSWSELTDDEWETMAYRSMNTLGFVGFQFGEALLIDLGYYDDDFYYGNGAASNTWDGTWTGKNGVNSLEDFMTQDAQDVAIREAFGYNLGFIENGLNAQGRSLDEFLGTTISYTTGGQTVPVEVTLTGVAAAAHLRGATSVVNLLLDGTLSNDEFGTSILQYMDQFGGYDSPQAEELIAYYEGRLTGDEGLGTPGDTSDDDTTNDGSTNGGTASDGTAGVSAATADVVIDWAWGTNAVETSFNPATDTIFVGWLKAEHIDVAESNGNVVFSIPSNNQTVTLQGVSLSQLSAQNFTFLEPSAAAEILSLVGQGSDGDGTGDDAGDDAGGDTGGNAGGGADDDAGGNTGGNAGGGTGGNNGGGNAGGDTGGSGEAPIIAAYFPEWGIYGRDFNVADVEADKITNLIYAFVNVNDQFEIQLHDPWAATDKAFPAEDSVDGVADTWDQAIAGNFNQLAELKEEDPHLTVQLGIGGWTLSQHFSDMASTAQGRATFIDSVVQFLQDYPMFDGIDFDWEYPGGGGLAGNSASEDDGANFTLLAAETRAALDQLEADTGRTYTISAALPGGHDKIENLDIPGLAESLDFMNIMTYDYYGAWQNTTGHLAGMYDLTGGDYDITTSIQMYLDAGVDPSQIVLGLPAYTRAWGGVSVDNPSDAWNSSSSGGAPGTWEAGNYDYKDLLAELQAVDSDWGLYYDDNAQAAFLYNPTLGIFSSFETPSTIALKSEWAQSLGLGGVMFWDLSGDSSGSESLITAAYNSWFEGMTFYEIDDASALEFDAVYGGDGVFAPIAESDTPPTDLPDGSGDDAGDDAGDGSGDDTGGDAGDDAGDDTGGNTGGGTGGGAGSGASGNGTAGVNANTADVVVNWAWGNNATVTDFDPATDTIYVGWFTSATIDVSEVNGSTVFSIPSNNQTVTLQGVGLTQLSAANFTIMDDSAAQEILALVGQEPTDTGGDTGDGAGNDDGGNAGDDDGGNGGDDAGNGDGTGDNGGSGPFVGGGQTFTVGENTVITDFDPTTDVLDLGPYSIHDQFAVDTPDGFMMLNMWDSNRNTLLEGVNLGDLSAENFAPINDAHLQQDMSAILAFENGSGLVRPNTVYIRSHEEGLEEIVDFNPATDKISFFYLSVRGDGQRNFAVEDTDEGARFYNPLTGQSLTLRDVSFSELDSSHFEWRASQLEDSIATRMGLDAVVDGFSYVSENVFTGKSVEMAGGVDRAPYHSEQGYEEYTGTPIGNGSDDGGSGDDSSVDPGGDPGDGGSDSGTGDDSAPIGVTVTGGSVTEADPGMDHVHDDGSSHVHDDGHRYINFTVTLDAPATEELTLTYATSDGTAVADTTSDVAWDYHTATGDLVFAAGEQTRTVMVAVHPDTLVEGTETFTFAVSGDNVTGTLEAVGTIFDNDTEDTGDDGAGGDSGSDSNTGNQIEDVVQVNWDWGTEETISDFAPSEDLIDFGAMKADLIEITESDGDLHIEILQNGGHKYILENVQAEDLALANLSAPDWNDDVLHGSNGVVQKLTVLGNDDLA